MSLAATEGAVVRCDVCERRCAIADGECGWCRTRKNFAGELKSLIYGRLSSVAADPIEKKPLYHFHPGTLVMTAGSWGCNFACPWCQNFSISKRVEEMPERVEADEFVRWALEAGCQGVAFSYNEPTLSREWAMDVIPAARRAGLYAVFVTNGSMTAESFELLAGAGLQALNVDIKGDSEALHRYCAFDPAVPWATCRRVRAAGLHLEVTTLVIPGVNGADRTLEALAQRIAGELGSDTPWHVSAYHPAWRFDAPATSPAMLDRAAEIGRDAGLSFVYTGNISGGETDTLCPGCGKVLVRRMGFRVLRVAVKDGGCPRCRRPIPGVWG
jgi:pyruvate formate lyase activating enzyme